VPRASFGQRVAAFAIDLGIILVVELILSVAVGFVVFAISRAGSDTAAAVVGVVLGLVVFLLYEAIPILYFGYMEGRPPGQTFGKRSLGIRVVDFESAGSVPMGRAIGRSLVRTFLSGLFMLGYLWMLWDPEAQTWHDKLTDTTVVPVSAYPV